MLPGHPNPVSWHSFLEFLAQIPGYQAFLQREHWHNPPDRQQIHQTLQLQTVLRPTSFDSARSASSMSCRPRPIEKPIRAQRAAHFAMPRLDSSRPCVNDPSI